MVTLLDCINRVPSKVETAISTRKENFKDLLAACKEHNFEAIMFVGSGTSNTASVTAANFVEKVTGLPCSTMVPNQFLAKEAFDTKTLYYFVSQSGTSHLIKLALAKAKEHGCYTVSMCDNEKTPLALAADATVSIRCEDEEYGMRTIGYVIPAVTEMLFGIELGLQRGTICEKCAEGYLEDLRAAAKAHPEVVEKTNNWFDAHYDEFKDFKAFVLYGAGDGPLYGTAMEGALKLLEIARHYMAVGYELDDGLHGPDMAFTKEHCVIVLSEDSAHNNLAQGITKYMRNDVSKAYMVGENVLCPDCDIAFEPTKTAFKFVQYSAFIQVFAYRMAVKLGVNLVPMAEMTAEQATSGSGKYFHTHDE